MGKIIITFTQEGETKVETKDVSGSGCIGASKFIEEALGNTLQTQKTGEYYQASTIAANEISQDI